jgi:hypothetical protein
MPNTPPCIINIFVSIYYKNVKGGCWAFLKLWYIYTEQKIVFYFGGDITARTKYIVASTWVSFRVLEQVCVGAPWLEVGV